MSEDGGLVILADAGDAAWSRTSVALTLAIGALIVGPLFLSNGVAAFGGSLVVLAVATLVICMPIRRRLKNRGSSPFAVRAAVLTSAGVAYGHAMVTVAPSAENFFCGDVDVRQAPQVVASTDQVALRLLLAHRRRNVLEVVGVHLQSEHGGYTMGVGRGATIWVKSPDATQAWRVPESPGSNEFLFEVLRRFFEATASLPLASRDVVVLGPGGPTVMQAAMFGLVGAVIQLAVSKVEYGVLEKLVDRRAIVDPDTGRDLVEFAESAGWKIGVS